MLNQWSVIPMRPVFACTYHKSPPKMIKEPCILDAEWEKEIGKRAIKEADWAEFIPLIDVCELATALDTSY